MNPFNPIMHSKKIAAVATLVYLVFKSSFLPAQTTWTGQINTDWNTPANWSSSTVPGSSTTVIIPNSVTRYPVISTGINALAASVTVNSGAGLTLNNTGNLTISNNGAFSNSGNFSATGSGAVIFAGKGTITGVTAFKNVTINGIIDFGTSSTITGTLLFNAGGAAGGAGTHTVIYGSASTLVYNETITCGNEWSAGSASVNVAGSGVPENVTLQSGTVSVASSGGSANRALAGNLVINAGATFMLSTTTNRDLYIAGNWTNNGGSLIANGRKVTFNGTSGTQTVSGSTTFFDLTLDNLGATTDFGSSAITINDEFRTSHGTMEGGASTFIFIGSSCTLEGAGAKKFYDMQIPSGSTVSDLTPSAGDIHIANSFTNNGTFNQYNTHTAYFDRPGATENIYGTGSTTFGNLTIGLSVGTATILNANAHSFTVSGKTMQFNFSNSSFIGGTSTVTFALTAAGTVSIKNASGVSGTTASFYNVSVNKTGSSVATALNVGSGIAAINNYLTINDNGSVTSAPLFANTATLIYNAAVPAQYNTGAEWNTNNAAAGLGVPQNVSVTNANAVAMAADRTVPGILTLTSGSLDINDHTLTVTGGFAGLGGYLKGSAGSGLITSGTGTIYFKANDDINNNITNNYLKTLTVNGASASIVIGDSLNIAPGTAGDNGTVTVTGGTLHANGKLILKSGSNGTARVGYSTGSIQDSVIIERYIPPLRAWRFLGVPFSTSTQTIRDAWQEGVNNYSLDYSQNQNPHPGFGTHITGNNIGTLGFDLNTTTNPSIKVWDSALNTWNVVEPPTVSTNIASYKAYCIFVRGSRAVPLYMGTGAPADQTVLRMKGVLNQNGAGYLEQYNAGGGKVVFVGNPYASSVNIYNLVHSRASGFVADLFYVWDPKRTGSGTNNVGGYVTYNNGIMTPGSSPSYPIPDSVLIVESGQAFMLQLNNGSNAAILNFNEGDKVTTENNVFGFAGKQAPIVQAPPAIYTNLLVPGANNFLSDGVATGFGNGFSAKVDEHDAAKLWNFDENISLFRDNSYLSIELRPAPVLSDTLFYRMYLRQEPYTLKFYTQNFESMPPMRAWLVDRYLNTKTEINLHDTTLYSFTPNPDTLSYRNRFMLVFNRQFTATPVPVTRVINQDNPDITGVANSLTTTAGSINIYPNPASTDKVMLQFSNMDKGYYEVTVYSPKGQKLAGTEVSYPGGNIVFPLPLNPSWDAGVYNVGILNKDSKKTINLRLVINK